MDRKAEIKKTVILAVLIFVVLISLLIAAIVGDAENFSLFGDKELVYVSDDTLSRLVSKTIIENCDINVQSSECVGEGHIILGTDSQSDTITVYTLTRYGAYAFENGEFVRLAGRDVLPVVMTFGVSDGDQFELLSYDYPSDDTFVDDANRLFPKKYRDTLQVPSDENLASLAEQETAYAVNYLASIGRDAQIAVYGDEVPVGMINKQPLALLGATADALSTITERYPNNPLWNGNREMMEGDVRYVYESLYIEESGKIQVSKYPYGTQDYVYCELVDIETGKVSVPYEEPAEDIQPEQQEQ